MIKCCFGRHLWAEVLIGIIQNQQLIPFCFFAGSSCSSQAHTGVTGLRFWVEHIKALKVFGKIFLITLTSFFALECLLQAGEGHQHHICPASCPAWWCTSNPVVVRASRPQFLLKPTQKGGFVFWGAKMRIKKPLSLMFPLTTSGFGPQDPFLLGWLNFPDFQLPGKSHPTEQGWGEHSQLPQLWELKKTVSYGIFLQNGPRRGVFPKVFHSPTFPLEQGVKVASAALHLQHKMGVKYCPQACEVLSETELKYNAPSPSFLFFFLVFN